jgi:uncharacterized protein (DUF433 family)
MERDEWFESLPEADKSALRADALSWPDRKMQRYGEFFWRPAGPFDWTECDEVEVVIGRLSGVPTLKNSRFSADNLLALHENGMSAEDLVEDYDLELIQVRAVLSFAEAQKQALVTA